MTQPQAIHAHCLRCCSGHEDEVKSCPCTDCTLHPYRLGTSGPEAPERAALFTGRMCTLHPYRLGTSGPEAPERAALFTGRMAPPKHHQRIETRKENEV